MHIFYDKELAMIAQLQMTTEYYNMFHTTNKFHYNNVIHILLGTVNCFESHIASD